MQRVRTDARYSVLYGSPMYWFGEPWPSRRLRAPICECDAHQVPTPVGDLCLLCDESVDEDDQGVMTMFVTAEGTAAGPRPIHIECQTRNTVGNLHHLLGHCTHIGECNEMSTQTFRQEALAVWAYLERQR